MYDLTEYRVEEAWVLECCTRIEDFSMFYLFIRVVRAWVPEIKKIHLMYMYDGAGGSLIVSKASGARF